MKSPVPMALLLLACLANAAVAAAGAAFAVEEGFVSLFNGSDLTGWGYRTGAAFESYAGKTESPDGRYTAKEGVLIVNERVPRMIQTLATEQSLPANFVLRLEFRASEGADSGVFLRGVQLQCRDFFRMGPYYQVSKYRPQDWNLLEITVRGTTAYATCNGQVLEPSFMIGATGFLGLEGDMGIMEFRRIRLKELPEAQVVPSGR